MRLGRQFIRVWLLASLVWLLIAGGWSYLRASADLVDMRRDHDVYVASDARLRHLCAIQALPDLVVGDLMISTCRAVERLDRVEPTLADAVARNWVSELAAALMPPLLFYLAGLWACRRGPLPS